MDWGTASDYYLLEAGIFYAGMIFGLFIATIAFRHILKDTEKEILDLLNRIEDLLDTLKNG
jgi:hypothetical protein